MFHVGGLNCQLVMATATGAQLIYPPPGRWREDQHLQYSEAYRATNWSLVPTQLWRLLDWPDLASYNLTSVRGVGGGSAVWAPELLRRLEETLPWARPGLGLGYGMTETNGLGTSLRVPETYEHPDSTGEASPGVEVQVRDPGTGEVLTAGIVGEICLRTPAGFLGYWDNPAATDAALDAERWYHTGDYGHITDGLLYLEGRRRDLIIRGGENIYPVEIENRLLEHPAVAEVAVIGVDHPTLGQEVKALIVTRSPVTADEVRAWVAATLASFKVPTHVEFGDSLPHNPVGKVMKHLLEQPDQASGFVPE
jgi:acyl-CoA synthetase (AMP-forming)/AMP-acid ligase II